MSRVYENKDCLEFLKTVKDDSVDLVLTDPPYFEIVKNEWDNQWESEKEYLDWCRQWTAECVRVLKPGKCLYVWGTTKTDTFLRYKLDVLNSYDELYYQNWIIWSYDWGGRTKKTFPRKHEDLLMYSKGKEFDFFADQVMVERAVKTNMNISRKKNLIRKYFDVGIKDFNEKDVHSWGKYRFSDMTDTSLKEELKKLEAKEVKFQAGKLPTDVWSKNNHTTSVEYAGWHPTQKPLQLLERIIKAHTKEGDTVLDIFNGSGSTMIACELTGRSFFGCEVNKEYYDKSKERMEKVVPILSQKKL
jgi:DNA modification methylase